MGLISPLIKWNSFISLKLWREGTQYTSPDMKYGMSEEPAARLKYSQVKEVDSSDGTRGVVGGPHKSFNDFI